MTNHPILNSLVLFITGASQIDVNETCKITFQMAQGKTLLEADSCFNKVVLPVGHKSYVSFKKACSTSLEFGALGYGRF